MKDQFAADVPAFDVRVSVRGALKWISDWFWQLEPPGTVGIDEMGERIFRLMLETASGRKTKSELHGYGQNEFVPWQLGAVM